MATVLMVRVLRVMMTPGKIGGSFVQAWRSLVRVAEETPTWASPIHVQGLLIRHE
jgi:hypothetical protein